MRILQVVPVFSDSFGGPVTVVRSISKELAKKHEVVVYTTTAFDSKHDFAPKEEEVNGYKIVYFKRSFKPLCYSGIFGQFNLSFDMMKAVKDNLKKFDVVHVHSWQQFPDVLVHKYSAKYGIPYVLQLHGSLPNIMNKKNLKQAFDNLFGKKLLKDASMIIATCQMEAKQYQRANIPNEKIVTIPNALTSTDYTNLPLKGDFKKRLGLTENQKLILYLGRIHEIKGIDVLVKSFTNIIHEFDSARLVIIGPDDGYLSELKSLIKTLKMEKNIIILGPLYGRAKIEAYVNADVCVFPSKYEIFGMTIIEASACARPVIATDVSGSAPEMIVNGKTGFLIKPDDVLDLTKRIKYILLNEKESNEMGKQARVRALALFSVENIVPILENLYLGVSR